MSEDSIQAEQRAAVERLCRAAGLAVDGFVMDHYDQMNRVTPAEHTSLIIEAAIGYLIGEGLIEEVEPDEERWLPLALPRHLTPDVQAALDRAEKMRKALRP